MRYILHIYVRKGTSFIVLLLLRLLNRGVFEFWFTSARNIRDPVLEGYRGKEVERRKPLKQTKLAIYVSFDLWTAKNRLAMLGVVPRFQHKSVTAQSLVLALRELPVPHSGENQGKFVAAVLEDFGIPRRGTS